MLNELPAVFNECCDKHSERFALDTAWIDDGYAYATDGRIAVRMSANLLSPELQAALTAQDPKGRRRPKGSDVFSNQADAFNPEPAAVALPIGVFALIKDECQECGHVSQRKNSDDSIEAIPGYHIAAYYTYLIQKHFGGQVYLPVRAFNDKREPIGPCRFESNGVEGVVMPMRREPGENRRTA